MATKVHMEALSPTMEEGQVVKWLKSEGDSVSNGEVLAEIETDKATMELVARGDGTLRKIIRAAGSTVPVGEIIAVIAAEGEDISALVPAGAPEGPTPVAKAASAKAAAEAKPTESKAAAAPSAAPASAAPPAVVAGDAESRIRASPLARRLAADEGLELGRIPGSGPAGRIVKRDVEKAVEEGIPAAASSPVTSSPSMSSLVAFTQEEAYRDIPLSQLRKTIAKRLAESLGPVPHFFLTVDVDMARAVEARRRVNTVLEADGVKVSLNDIVLKSVAVALRKHPECNAHWGGDHIRQFNGVHLGVAVAIPDGLITPVVRYADRKGLAAIATEVRDLATRARAKKLKPDEYTGSTFSVSNLGMLGIRQFTGVINPPEAGILAVGSVEERPVVVDGQLRAGTVMTITMSCDHRVIDGAQGARFLQTLKAILEEPLAALI
ncbi:MAG: pyruvate dehydrogenase complex dihydrolipoamide acetyltransferase [Gemmatimonadetes bacterium]|nr:pyruvate dehydrogenase complex dihydrolipoamide acetyltransferase [Gemmatimonadota bacterium]